jgi:polyhydroxyalkanoate synthesis regulator phasin
MDKIDDDRTGIVSRLKDAWKETVGAYATDEGATKNLFARLVDFGALSRDEAVRLVADTKARIEQNRSELDRRIDESIRRTATRLRVPSPDEIKALDTQVSSIERRLAALEQKRG